MDEAAPAAPRAEAPADEAEAPPRLARVAVYASMAPRARASASVLRRRQLALLVGQTCTHWPFDATCLDPPATAAEHRSDPLPHATALVKQLTGYTDEQLRAWAADSHADDALHHGHRRPAAAHGQYTDAEIRELVSPPGAWPGSAAEPELAAPSADATVGRAEAAFASPLPIDLVVH